MKRKILLSLILLSSFSTYLLAQCPVPNLRYIEVNGKAEEEIQPNEIYVQITLKEYFPDTKNPKPYTKVTINSLETQLQKAVLNNGIPAKDLTISNISSYNDYSEPKKRRPSEYLARKQYLIKMNSIVKMENIISQLDKKGIASTYVSKYSNTEIHNHQKALQTRAFNDAKTKAINIASVAGAKIGKVLEIHDLSYIDEPGFRPFMMMRSSTADTNESMPEINFKNIKMRSEQRVLFELL